MLNLLSFNAGVDLSIDSVRLLIQNVHAKVLLEARLENLVKMINSTLSSIDLNPIIATLGEGLGEVLNSTGQAVGNLTSSSLSTRSLSFELENGILYSTNNYRADKHTNRVLEQNGDILAVHLNNDGKVLSQHTVGNYKKDMRFNGYEVQTEYKGQAVTEKEYVYEPFAGLSATCAIYFDAAGEVVGTQIIAEATAGGSSSIGNE